MAQCNKEITNSDLQEFARKVKSLCKAGDDTKITAQVYSRSFNVSVQSENGAETKLEVNNRESVFMYGVQFELIKINQT